MDWHVITAGISAGLLLTSVGFYIKDILHGSTRPNLVSQSLWFLLGCITVSAQIVAGASWSVVLPLISVTCMAFILTLIFFGYGYRKYRPLDGICFVLALSTLGIWYLTSNPNLAIVLSVTTSFIAVMPTIAKTYHEPHSEHAFAWLLTFVAALFSLSSTRVFDIANVAYPIYVIIESGMVTLLAYWGQSEIGKR